MSKHTDTGPTGARKEPVMVDMKRCQYDLSHWSHKVGAIGALQTLSVIPVVAGDSMQMNASFVARLSPLRRYMYLDAVVDLFAFYVPHRHIYGSNWTDFIKAGFDESTTLGTDTVNSNVNLDCLGFYAPASFVMPRWLSRGYVQIWNRYFRDPSDVAGLLSEDYFTTNTGSDIAAYGLKCAHIKKIWNSATLTTLASGDYSLPLSGGEVNLYELAALKGRLQTETMRDYYAVRYNDVLNNGWGSTVNTDADQRPTLVMRSRQWLSGKDVDGTDDATLGRFSGKSAGVMNLNFPSRFFPEHGALWITALVRFPPILYNEQNYLVSKSEPTYAQIAGDPELIRRTAPIDLNMNEITPSGVNVVVGKTPYAQWYREQPSLTHRSFINNLGHPFIDSSDFTVRNDAVYISPTRYDSVFQTLQLKHWQMNGCISLTAKRFIPDVRESIFAGTE